MRRKSRGIVGTALLVLGTDAGRIAGDVRRTSDMVRTAAHRRQGLPAAQRARRRRLRHHPVLRAKHLARSQVTPASRLLRTYSLPTVVVIIIGA